MGAYFLGVNLLEVINQIVPSDRNIHGRWVEVRKKHRADLIEVRLKKTPRKRFGVVEVAVSAASKIFKGNSNHSESQTSAQLL